MQERVDQEIALLRSRFPELEYQQEGQWVRIPSYPLPEGWNGDSTEIAFQIPASYPAGAPYGIYVPAGLEAVRAPLDPMTVDIYGHWVPGEGRKRLDKALRPKGKPGNPFTLVQGQ